MITLTSVPYPFVSFLQSKIKSNGSEPGSPVSSLEGPEACRHVFNFTLDAEDHSSVSDSLENDAHG